MQSEQEELRQREERERQQAAEHLEFPHRRRTLVVAGVTVVAVMAAYALATGLWKVRVVDDIADGVVKVVRGQKDQEIEFSSQSEKTRK